MSRKPPSACYEKAGYFSARRCTTTITQAYTGADVLAIREQDRYTTSIGIVMGEGGLEDPTTACDAAELRRSVTARY